MNAQGHKRFVRTKKAKVPTRIVPYPDISEQQVLDFFMNPASDDANTLLVAGILRDYVTRLDLTWHDMSNIPVPRVTVRREDEKKIKRR